uniref:Uncharacterized protein n=1 Tax=Candidatus Kentrum sp. TC TaxID=2126339 RepID=A0A450ZZ85_9GAMM|nr:MAG: hypothetical protein BECKTC1821E_GA0114239_102919 [Candidatus Kentron sp. TC]VFK46656.1 MAG: hypothetical protein BECKTC1821D_GA0114238_10345 [Candidatus Kentron sp. TC]VFK59067.1 MAG: hypothetical protein BECKTC1821F_GA0114240_10295 [Candidatus Kentron sp. TC]
MAVSDTPCGSETTADIRIPTSDKTFTKQFFSAANCLGKLFVIASYMPQVAQFTKGNKATPEQATASQHRQPLGIRRIGTF